MRYPKKSKLREALESFPPEERAKAERAMIEGARLIQRDMKFTKEDAEFWGERRDERRDETGGKKLSA